MASYKTGLDKYIRANGQEVYASQITGITLLEHLVNHPSPDLRGSSTLNIGNKITNVIGKYMNQHNPQVGGWFITFDNNDKVDATYASDEDFKKNYVKD